MQCDLARIAKLIPLLGSDKAGEVHAAALAIGRILESGDSDWHDLASVVSRGFQVRSLQPAAPAVVHDWQRIARACMRADGSLSTAQVDFLRNIAMRHTEPSEAQWRWLDAIAAALKVPVAA